jgi:putative toxin-antitoxin system antitoxin component (TIGR02293 family)
MRASVDLSRKLLVRNLLAEIDGGTQMSYINAQRSGFDMAEFAIGRRRPAREASRPFTYLGLFQASPGERVQIIKSGVSARQVKIFISEFNVDQKLMFEALNLKTATVNRKAAKNEALSIDDGERVVGLAKLVGQLEAMVEESGNPEGFDPTSWLATWLREPLPALGGVKPLHLLDTMEGQAMVSRALAQSQSGAYA